MDRKRLVVTIIILSASTLILSLILARQLTSKTSPLMPLSQTPIQITPQGHTNYQVIGFLPYWQLANIPYVQTSLLTNLAYFGIAIDDDGEIKTRLSDNTRELGLHRLNQTPVQSLLTKQTPTGQTSLVVRAMSTTAIQAAIDNQANLIPALIELKNQSHFSGFNIDFEPDTATDDTLATNFTAFVAQLKQSCDCYLSVDVYASAGTKPRIWQLTTLSQVVDHIIIMGYDFHRTSSPQSGPVAPIYGSPNRWEYDLNSTLNQIYSQVPHQKIILAVPWYGYQWPTLSATPQAMALNNGYLATYSRIQTTILDCQSQALQNCQTGYDPDALSPFLIFQQSNQWQQIWYDDIESLAHKYQLVKDHELGGIAIWALGYEAPYLDLWQQIDQHFFNQ